MFKKLFSIFKKKNVEDDEYEEYLNASAISKNGEHKKINMNDLSMPLSSKIDYKDKEARLCHIRDCCEQIINAEKVIEETRIEFGAVTNYVTDVQLVKNHIKDGNKGIVKKAGQITKLNKDNEKTSVQKNAKISDSQYNLLQPYEDIIPDEIIKLEEYEKHHEDIEDDMRKLEGERGSLKYEHKSIVRKQEFLKLMMTATLMIVIMLTCLYLCINKVLGSDTLLAFLITVAVAAIVALYAAIEGSNNKKRSKLNGAKMNRLVELVNKTKIKYVNSKGVIDYMYTKYGVKSVMELKYLWGQYIIRKQAEEKLERNNQLLDSYSSSLIRELENIGLSDAQVWLHQIDAILDNDKIQQIEKRLIDRRDKLKSTIEYNNKLIEMGRIEIKKIVDINSDYRLEVVAILKRYGIILE